MSRMQRATALDLTGTAQEDRSSLSRVSVLNLCLGSPMAFFFNRNAAFEALEQAAIFIRIRRNNHDHAVAFLSSLFALCYILARSRSHVDQVGIPSCQKTD